VEPRPDGPDGSGGTETVEAHWAALVTTALLGTDRRDPPEPIGPLADLVADTARIAPSERMLAQVAACTVIRRAGVLPGPALAPLAAPAADDRPVCPPAAVDRWHHITTSWPVLEDEWMLMLIRNGWRIDPEVIPAMLVRHRSDAVRRSRVMVGAGPIGPWLVAHVDELAAVHPRIAVNPEALAELPDLPIPPDLVVLLDASGAESGGVVAAGIESGAFGPALKAVLVNVVARMRSDALVDLADVVSSVDSRSPGHGMATVLADLAVTRHRMLDELAR
jgi:hypothetical protein